MSRYQLVVVGGGPGGYVAAIRASQLGLKTALVEREHLGGVCLNWGCIPTKALLRSAELYESMLHAADFGLSADTVGFDIRKIVARSRDVSGKLNAGVKHLLKKNGVEVVEGHASLLGSGELRVAGAQGNVQDLQADNIILATGARPSLLPELESLGELAWTSKEAMTPEELPASLLVIGAGSIGLEFSSFYNTLGVEVTIVEMMPQILPLADAEIAGIARESFEKRGMKVLTDTRLVAAQEVDGRVSVTLEREGETLELVADRLICAVGVQGNHEGLGLEGTRVEVERSFVVVDEFSRTAEEGVFAIGDLAGGPCLAHKASHEGIICVEQIAGQTAVSPLDKTGIPACTYSSPQIASLGLTEQAAAARGFDTRVGRFPFAGNGKAIAKGETEGLVKTVFDSRTGELLGAHLVGADVTELIQGYGIARTLETTETELMDTVFPHPTLSEMMHESVLAAYDRALHI